MRVPSQGGRATGRRLLPPASGVQFESLEGRLPLAAGITWNPQQGSLTIIGSAGNDVAEVRRQGNLVVATLTTDSGTVSKAAPVARVRAIAFSGLDGNDTFTNSTSIRSTADGGAGDDMLTGGSGADRLIGGDGNDCLNGGAGADVLFGNAGDDTLRGGAGNDTISGGLGDDSIDGGEGNDVENGDQGNDLVFGGNGNDVLRGSVGSDQIFGGAGVDRLFGDDGADLLNGGVGRDVLVGGAGSDRDTDPDDGLADRMSEDDDNGGEMGDEMPGSGLTGMPLTFDPQGYASITGTSANRRDVMVYTFTATLDGMVSVVVGSIAGRTADVEVLDARSKTLLELEPQDNRISAGNVNVMTGESFLVIVRSHDLEPVEVGVRLRQHSMSGGMPGMPGMPGMM